MCIMDKKHYQAAQYIMVLLFIAFFVYVVSYRCESTLLGTLLCGPKVLSVGIWFVVGMALLKITETRIKKSEDNKEAALFWTVNVIVMALYAAAFFLLFVMNYI